MNTVDSDAGGSIGACGGVPTTTASKVKTKMGKKQRKKGAATESLGHRCFHCWSEGAKMCCSQCHLAWYCGKPCQKRQWRQHKRACEAAVAAEARRATRVRKATAARKGGEIDKGTCVICVAPVELPVELPCGHAYCATCLAERKHKVAQTCPQCRATLPPGLDGLYDLAYRMLLRIEAMVIRGEVCFGSLPAALLEEVGEAIAMLTEAAAQGHEQAQGILHKWSRLNEAATKGDKAAQLEPSARIWRRRRVRFPILRREGREGSDKAMSELAFLGFHSLRPPKMVGGWWGAGERTCTP